MDTAQFLAAGDFVDSDAPQVSLSPRTQREAKPTPTPKVLRLYTAVRDGIIYDPYVSLSDPANYRASSVLTAGRGFCIGKSALLAAGARMIGVPARVGYADVRNHLTSRRLYDLVKTDTFMWHSYTELYLVGPLGQGDARFRPRAVRAHRPQAARLRRRRPIRCFSRSIRPGDGTWNTCATAAHLPTCRSTSFAPTSSRIIQA